MGTNPLADPVITRQLDAAGVLNVQRLLDDAAREDGFGSLTDQLVADLADVAQGEAADTVIVLLPWSRGDLAGYAQASRRDGEWTLQRVISPAARDDTETVTGRLLRAGLAAIAGNGGGRVDWWVYDGAGADTAAEAYGLRLNRELLQMRRPLPAPRRSSVPTRSFRVGEDEAAWLAVNNRAFAGHHEQGDWSLDTLQQRMRQPWFDPDDVRLHERDGRLAAFCWTKKHTPSLREIYVIGVDPDFQGLGLGKELTLAGLDHMVDGGATEALLYVAGENTAARSMYEHLGFVVHRVDRAYLGNVTPARL